MQEYREGQLQNKMLDEVNRGPMGAVMYKFYAAYLINELISNQLRIFDKKEEAE